MSNKEVKSFNSIKNEYECSRNEQRKCLVNYLSVKLKDHNSLVVVKRGNAGKGKATYNNAQTIAPFNLNNWKWIEVKTEGFSCLISLNMIDLDKNSGNFHALYDRVGLVVYFKKSKNFYKNYICTDIDLPFDENKMEAVYKLVMEQFEFWNSQ